MGKMNLLKANWEGKVGQTVGAKWKNKSTIRTYTKPANPDTAAQQSVRGVFGAMTSFVAMFADQIKYLSALNTAGQSVRNAIVQINKEMISGGAFEKSSLIISKGGLQKVAGESGSASSGKVTITWNKPTATNFTADAKLIAVMVQPETGLVEVAEAVATAETLTGSMTFGDGTVDVYVYYLDKRGSNKVASVSDYISVTVA
ncbi:MAG: DUF6266 family protein [Ruminococcus sp.]|nr:DUF6266 family protein [Ruminococcus sp.]